MLVVHAVTKYRGDYTLLECKAQVTDKPKRICIRCSIVWCVAVTINASLLKRVNSKCKKDNIVKDMYVIWFLMYLWHLPKSKNSDKTGGANKRSAFRVSLVSYTGVARPFFFLPICDQRGGFPCLVLSRKKAVLLTVCMIGPQTIKVSLYQA